MQIMISNNKQETWPSKSHENRFLTFAHNLPTFFKLKFMGRNCFILDIALHGGLIIVPVIDI